MNINRHNYEEYFLLYTDNELTVAERNMVEAFASANADLQEELLMLQQSVAKPMPVCFPAKTGLYKPGRLDTVTEEKLLLLLDDELRGDEKTAMLSLIQGDDAVKQEWELLQQAKFCAEDTILFNDKASLYKKETGSVVVIKWWRVAAAAMLIGFGLWGAVSYLDNGRKTNGKAHTAGVEKNNTTGNYPATVVASENNQKTLPASQDEKTTTAANTPKKEMTAGSIGKKIPVEINTALPQMELPSKTVERTIATAASKENEENGMELLERINNQAGNEKLFASVTPETSIHKTESAIDNSSTINNTIAINTSFNNGTGYNETFVFEEDEDKPRKTKLGGFFKRAKRVLERKTKIKTGNDDEVRIANMSFAMH